MNTEYEARLQDNQEALVSLNARLGEMEKREKERQHQKKEQQEQQKREEGSSTSQTAISFPENKACDFGSELQEIKQVVLKIAESATPVKKAEELNMIMERVLARLPKRIATITLHRFDKKAKAWIAAAYGILLLVAVLSGFTFSQWRENGKLRANDVKFRLIRQYYPMAAFWADTAYRHRPEKMALLAEKLEAMATDSNGFKAKETGVLVRRKPDPIHNKKNRQNQHR